ncbi:MAG: protein translocase subunit SecF, partial [Proteobacteria bacterium]|nr:protein translocase subunit SecF [Pseudomonadota bacterium]
MEFIKSGTNVDFLGKRRLTLIFSLALIIITFASLIYKKGPNYGIDFSGGTQVIVKFKDDVTSSNLRESLKAIDLGDMLVQNFGDEKGEFLIRIERGVGDQKRLSLTIREHLNNTFGADKYEVQSIEMVGPQVGGDLKNKALMAIIYAMVGILIYVSVRFEFRYAVGAIVAILHDVIITVGAFSITNYEISLSVVAAILAVIGYSLNDTIIVYDRIRE